MTKQQSLYRLVITSVAEQLARDQGRAEQDTAALRDRFALLIDQALCSLLPGERLLVPKLGFERQRRRLRIDIALSSGYNDEQIARMERVSKRWVRKLRSSGTFKP